MWAVRYTYLRAGSGEREREREKCFKEEERGSCGARERGGLEQSGAQFSFDRAPDAIALLHVEAELEAAHEEAAEEICRLLLGF